MTVRFWEVINGSPVLLSIAKDEHLYHRSSQHTDEGWRTVWRVWTHDGQAVYCGERVDETDCDGRHEREWSSFFYAGEQAKGYGDPEYGITYPRWHEVPKSVRLRDYYAEAMNY